VLARLAIVIVALIALVSSGVRAAGEYAVRGMVLRIDPSRTTFVISHERIEGLMDSMTMPFDVREARELEGVVPGAIVEFTLVVKETGSYATSLRVKKYESVEQDPRAARRLGLLDRLMRGAPNRLTVGQPVPDFTLIDQTNTAVSLASLRGRVVALNFVYTRCALPQFCLRMANTFGVLHKRFARQYGRDLVLLTVTFDPARDRPEVLAKYASQWNADPAMWHFLTGSVRDVRRLCAAFGVEAFPDEGLINHSLRTAVIDRQGKLTASVEGNQFTPEQLGDLVLSALNDNQVR
jgi:protein SCO1/2